MTGHDPRWSELPGPLQKTLEASYQANQFDRCRFKSGVNLETCFNKIDSAARSVLLSIYHSFHRLQLWPHVRYVVGLWDTGTGGVKFLTGDAKALLRALHPKGTWAQVPKRSFCADIGIGNLLHSGTSFREITDGAGLHITLGKGDPFTAHIDKISPVATNESASGLGRCVYHPIRAAAHIGREAVQGVVRLPGIQIFPEGDHVIRAPSGKKDSPQPEIVRWVLFRL